MRHYAHIDGLRALAVVPVILFHFGMSAFSGPRNMVPTLCA